jgi:hypothetical protein
MTDSQLANVPKRVQFSLRTLLIIVPAAGIYLGLTIYAPMVTIQLTLILLILAGAIAGGRLGILAPLLMLLLLILYVFNHPVLR